MAFSAKDFAILVLLTGSGNLKTAVYYVTFTVLTYIHGQVSLRKMSLE